MVFSNYLDRTGGMQQFVSQFNPQSQPIQIPESATPPIVPQQQQSGGGNFLGDLLRATKPGRAMTAMQNERQQRGALAELSQMMQSGKIDREQAMMKYAEITGDFSPMFGSGSRQPASVQEWNKFNEMSPEDQQRYLQMKRSNQMFNRGDAQIVLDPQGNVVNQFEMQLKPEQRPETKFEQSRQTELGKTSAEKTAGLSNLENQASYMINTIDQLLNPEDGLAEGVDEIVGGTLGLQGIQSSVFPVTENQRKFQPFIDQLKGQTFLEAYERLKGGGVITEIEGQKAEQAIARLNQAQSEKDFEAALRELRGVIGTGLDRAKKGEQALAGQTGQGQTTAPSAPKTIKFGDLK